MAGESGQEVEQEVECRTSGKSEASAAEEYRVLRAACLQSAIG